MLNFLLLCLATASISAAVPLNPPLQAVLQSPIKTAPSPLTAYDILFQQIRETESPRTFVGVSFESSSSLDMPLQYFEFPLGERISPRMYLQEEHLCFSFSSHADYHIVEFPMLPLHPAHARIVNGTMRTGLGMKLLSVERLLNVICLAYPEVGGEEDDEQATGLSLSTADARPVWWLSKDGEVDFEDPFGRWSLAGREVESYECI